MAILRSAHPKAMWPGVFKWFGMSYAKHDKQYTDLVEVMNSKKKYEEIVNSYGFGLAPEKPEGSSVTYDTHAQGYVARFTHVAYALGYIVSKEEMDDNLYKELSRQRSAALAFSMNQTKENVVANMYDRAFNSSYTGGDGKELLATDHPLMTGGTFSNELATPADLSPESIEDLTIQIMGAVNDRNLKINIKPESLIVPRQLIYEARRILESELESGTANNDVNVLRGNSVFPKGIKMNTYLDDPDAWFIRTNCPTSLIMFQRNPVEFSQDNDFDTMNARAKAYERYSVFWADPRGLYGSAGA